MRVAVTGYASLDHVALLADVPQPGRTSTILARPEDAWPRLGGSPAYVAAALAENGVAEAFPVSWVGDDEAGRAYRKRLAGKGVRVDGLAVVEGARTPVSVLAYEPSGGCICLYHPGIPEGLTLASAQRAIIAEADWVCVTIGPPAATAAALDMMDPAARLAWVVKDDPRAISPELASRLASRADLIFSSAAETGFLRQAMTGVDRHGQLVIETRGSAGASASRGGIVRFVSAEPVSASDPTGAGDTFAGGALAALLQGETDAEEIVRAGHRAARALLASRRIRAGEVA